MVDDGQAFRFLKDSARNHSGRQVTPPLSNAQIEATTHIDQIKFPQHASTADSVAVSMDINTKRMVDDLVDCEAGDEQVDTKSVVKQMTTLGKQVREDISHCLTGSATISGHFGEEVIGPQLQSRSLLPSIEKSPFAPRPNEQELLTSPSIPTYEMTPAPSQKSSSQNAPLLQQQSRYIEVSSGDSSVPTPTFQDTNPDSFSTSAGHQHPSVRARQVEKALDESNFLSSNIFPGSTLDQTQDD